MGQHPPDFAATTAKPQLDPCHFRAIPPRYFKACPSFVTAYGMAVKKILNIAFIALLVGTYKTRIKSAADRGSKVSHL